MAARVNAMKGLNNSGKKNVLPRLARFTPADDAINPLPTNAPVIEWVVEIG